MSDLVMEAMNAMAQERGAKDGPKARLAETGERANALEGDRIRFWVDSEQVEVTNATLATKRDDNKMKGELLK